MIRFPISPAEITLPMLPEVVLPAAMEIAAAFLFSASTADRGAAVDQGPAYVVPPEHGHVDAT